MTQSIQGAGDEPAIRVLLVDDQRMVGEAVRRMLADETHWVFEYCADPEQAVAVAEAFAPTVILQDLVMPGIDGFELVRQYGVHATLQHVPTIVLSSQESAQTKADAFSRGATDYLVKLPDPIELKARIRHHSTGYIHLLERNQAYDALAASQKALAGELAEAADYVRSLLPPPAEMPVRIRWDFQSCSSVGGDSFGYRWLDDDTLMLYLLDVCGHGVGAALMSVSVMNTLSGVTFAGLDLRQPPAVLAKLNELFEMEKHNFMYFTLWYGIYDRRNGTLTYATAGHPPGLLYREGQADPEQLNAPALPIGTMPDTVYTEGQVSVAAGDRLYVYSDGVYEVQLEEGREMQLEDFIPLLSKPLPDTADGLKMVRNTVAGLQNSEQFDDDFTLVEVCF